MLKNNFYIIDCMFYGNIQTLPMLKAAILLHRYCCRMYNTHESNKYLIPT